MRLFLFKNAYIRKGFFIQRMAGHWDRLAREVVTAPRLTEFKQPLDNILRQRVGFLCLSCARLQE